MLTAERMLYAKIMDRYINSHNVRMVGEIDGTSTDVHINRFNEREEHI